MTYGNVDIPAMWEKYAKPGHHILDGGTVDLDGWRFGFVGGGLQSAYRTPNEMPEEEFRAKLEAIGEVDVLCTHIPPAVPELLYDTVARRLEKGSVALLETIKATRPRYSVFGHVHQPMARRTRIGVTECLNVGHFRATGRPLCAAVVAVRSGVGGVRCHNHQMITASPEPVTSPNGGGQPRPNGQSRPTAVQAARGQARRGNDPVADFQRWLMRAGARSMANQVADQVRRTIGQERRDRR